VFKNFSNFARKETNWFFLSSDNKKRLSFTKELKTIRRVKRNSTFQALSD
jgi:hypothetical protein